MAAEDRQPVRPAIVKPVRRKAGPVDKSGVPADEIPAYLRKPPEEGAAHIDIAEVKGGEVISIFPHMAEIHEFPASAAEPIVPERKGFSLYNYSAARDIILMGPQMADESRAFATVNAEATHAVASEVDSSSVNAFLKPAAPATAEQDAPSPAADMPVPVEADALDSFMASPLGGRQKTVDTNAGTLYPGAPAISPLTGQPFVPRAKSGMSLAEMVKAHEGSAAAAVGEVRENTTAINIFPHEPAPAPAPAVTLPQNSEAPLPEREYFGVSDTAPYGGFYYKPNGIRKVKAVFGYDEKVAVEIIYNNNGEQVGQSIIHGSVYPPKDKEILPSDKAVNDSVQPLSMRKRAGNLASAIISPLGAESDPVKNAERRRKLAMSLSIGAGSIGSVAVAKMGATAFAVWLASPALVVIAAPVLATMATVGLLSYVGHLYARKRATRPGNIEPVGSLRKGLIAMGVAGVMTLTALFAPVLAVLALGSVVAAVGAGANNYFAQRATLRRCFKDDVLDPPSFRDFFTSVYQSRDARKAFVISSVISGALMGVVTAFTGSTMFSGPSVIDAAVPADSAPIVAPAAVVPIPDAAASAPAVPAAAMAADVTASSVFEGSAPLATTPSSAGTESVAPAAAQAAVTPPAPAVPSATPSVVATADVSGETATVEETVKGDYVARPEADDGSTVWDRVTPEPDQAAQDAAQAAFYDLPNVETGAADTPAAPASESLTRSPAPLTVVPPAPVLVPQVDTPVPSVPFAAASSAHAVAPVVQGTAQCVLSQGAIPVCNTPPQAIIPSNHCVEFLRAGIGDKVQICTDMAVPFSRVIDDTLAFAQQLFANPSMAAGGSPVNPSPVVPEVVPPSPPTASDRPVVPATPAPV